MQNTVGGRKKRVLKAFHLQFYFNVHLESFNRDIWIDMFGKPHHQNSQQ